MLQVRHCKSRLIIRRLKQLMSKRFLQQVITLGQAKHPLQRTDLLIIYCREAELDKIYKVEMKL
jgi:hypothetical protein